VRDWKQFAEHHRRSDPDFVSEREKLLQDHAKRYFKSQVSYLP
jgi:hypothetical protein